MMVTLWILTTMMFKTSDPFKMSIILLMLSIVSSLYMVYKAGSIWMTAMILLTFSSGMMIMFCYSASMINIETKKSSHLKSKNWVYFVTPMIIYNLNQSNMKTDLTMKEFTSSMMSTLLISIVILFMTPMMENCFNPANPMQSSF